MKTLEARTGLLWIRDGFRLLRKRPFLLTNLFIAYFLLAMLTGSLPVVGSVLPPWLAPTFSVLYLSAINEVHENRPFSFARIFSVLTKPVILRLLVLGGLYFLAAIIAVWISSFVDGGIFMRAMGGEQIEMQVILESRFKAAFAVAALINFLALLFFWFVTPLIAWKNMPVGQSLFYNLFTLIRAWKAFIVYLAGLLLVAFLIPMLINSLVMIILGRHIGLLVTFSLLMVAAVLVYCSFYSMYIYMFGVPATAAPAEQP
ncbi:MAG: hypothetical protein LBM56_01635 [Burkholderiaceae bacterium]|jgi:hypothetical protein|nr:hypothetical protein [Burkholderiaceae bacterium]